MRNFAFGRTLSIARHRLVDLASPSIDAAVEVDCVVKAGASKKVDHHLTASAMMANDHQQLIRWEVVGLRRNLRHRNMQRALVQTAGSGPLMISAELPEGWA